MKYFDAAVVGQGIVGKSIAYELLKANMKVVVFDGGLQNSASSAAQAINSIKGATSARDPLFRVKLLGHRIFDSWIADLNQNDGMAKIDLKKGAVEVFDSEKDYQTKIERSAHGEAFGIRRQQIFPGRELRNLPHDRQDILGAVSYPDDSCVFAPQLLTHLGNYLENHLRVLGQLASVHEVSDGWSLRDGIESVRAGVLVLAAGSQTNEVLKLMSLPCLDLHKAPGETLIFNQKSSINFEEWIISGKNNLTIFGSCMQYGSSTFRDDTERLSKRGQLRKEAEQLLVKLGYDKHVDMSTVTAVGGTRVRSKSRFPIIGPVASQHLESKLLVATGFYKNGFQLAPLAAKSICHFIKSGGAVDGFMRESALQNAT